MQLECPLPLESASALAMDPDSVAECSFVAGDFVSVDVPDLVLKVAEDQVAHLVETQLHAPVTDRPSMLQAELLDGARPTIPQLCAAKDRPWPWARSKPNAVAREPDRCEAHGGMIRLKPVTREQYFVDFCQRCCCISQKEPQWLRCGANGSQGRMQACEKTQQDMQPT